MSEKKFHTKGFISLLTALSMIFMTISGVVLYIVPPGRITYWTNWKLLFLTKENWIDMHVLTSLLFVIGAAYHIYLNWSIFTVYIVKKAERVLALKKELAIASVLTAIFVIASVYRIPPLSYVLTLSDYFKDSWVTSKELEPPFGRAELLSLKSFAKKMDIDLNSAIEELEESGIKVESAGEPIEVIAKKNNTSPMEIYAKIRKFERTSATDAASALTPQQVEEKFTGAGVGKKTLAQFAHENKIDMDHAKKKLAQKNIEIKESETLKQVAERYNTSPIELLKIILVDTEKQ
ncbi:MAG: DUF4405 domain-containing protein [Nitrospirae bacterium]|nr:DUF4405 domain-containing protein [Nitrospirota bacterium]